MRSVVTVILILVFTVPALAQSTTRCTSMPNDPFRTITCRTEADSPSVSSRIISGYETGVRDRQTRELHDLDMEIKRLQVENARLLLEQQREIEKLKSQQRGSSPIFVIETANDLKTACQSVERNDGDTTNLVNSASCMSYISAIVDVSVLNGTLCYTSDATLKDVTAVVTKYASALTQPEKTPAVWSVMVALQQQYPCPSPGTPAKSH